MASRHSICITPLGADAIRSREALPAFPISYEGADNNVRTGPLHEQSMDMAAKLHPVNEADKLLELLALDARVIDTSTQVDAIEECLKLGADPNRIVPSTGRPVCQQILMRCNNSANSDAPDFPEAWCKPHATSRSSVNVILPRDVHQSLFSVLAKYGSIFFESKDGCAAFRILWQCLRGDMALRVGRIESIPGRMEVIEHFITTCFASQLLKKQEEKEVAEHSAQEGAAEVARLKDDLRSAAEISQKQQEQLEAVLHEYTNKEEQVKQSLARTTNAVLRWQEEVQRLEKEVAHHSLARERLQNELANAELIAREQGQRLAAAKLSPSAVSQNASQSLGHDDVNQKVMEVAARAEAAYELAGKASAKIEELTSKIGQLEVASRSHSIQEKQRPSRSGFILCGHVPA